VPGWSGFRKLITFLYISGRIVERLIVSRLDDGSSRSRLLEAANKKWVAFRDAHSDYKAAISRGVVADLRSCCSAASPL